MNIRKQAWFIVVPPQGAAREAGMETASAFHSLLGPDCCKVFDSRKYLDFFSSQLKRPEETLVVDLVNHALVVQCLDSGAGNILVCALSPVTLFTLNLLRTCHVSTSHWFYEDFRRAGYWKSVLAGYDRFFAIQKGPLPAACSDCGCAYSFLPTAAATGCCSLSDAPVSRDRNKDVAFVGIASDYRAEVLEYLAAAGLSISIAGTGWDRYTGALSPMVEHARWTHPHQAAALLNNAKIGINLSIVSPDADRENAHVSPRAFDVLASGCTLVTEDVPLAHETLHGLHYHSFTNKEGAAMQITKALSDFKKESPMRAANAAAVCREHTFVNRASTIIRSAGDQ